MINNKLKEETMKNLSRVLLVYVFVAAFLICSALPVVAGENPTKEECITMVSKALDMLEEDGLDAVIPKINDKNGPFVWKGAYVFLLDTKEAKPLAHPYLPQSRIGVSYIGTKDVYGKAYFREFLDVANTKGKGWVNYVFMDANNRAREKTTYLLKSEKADVVILAGIFTDKEVARPKFDFPDMVLPNIKGKKVAFIVANKGFADNEFIVPKKMIEEAGGEIELFALSKGTACGMYGLTADIKYSLDDIRVPEFDAIVFIGGTGSNVYHENPQAHKIAKDAVKNNKILAAICWAPVILANARVLDGKMATVNPYEEKRFKKEACYYTGDKVTVDGKIITGDGPGSSAFFAKAIIESLNL